MDRSHSSDPSRRTKLRCSTWLLFLVGLVVVANGCLLAAPQESSAGSGTTKEGASFTVDADYPGGNILVERIDGDVVHLRHDLRDTEGWWFYWNFRVREAQGRTVTFVFSGRSPIGVRGPAVSTDGGKSWSWLGAAAVQDGSFDYAFDQEAEDVRFCFAIPYQEQNLQQFLAQYDRSPHIAVRDLCKTKKGRSVERLHVGRLDGDPRYRVLLTARHHACEMVANYVMEGVLDAALADNDDGYWFRRNVEFLAIPFMDKDGVEEGDQGKNRKPRDHNRDYIGKSVYPSVAALRDFVPNWSNDKLVAAFDLHCPYISGTHNEVIYIVGSPRNRAWSPQ